MELVKIKAETAKMKEMHLELLTAEQEGRIEAIPQSVKDVIQSCSVHADLMLKMLETSQEILRHKLGVDEVSCSE
jgi:hypothetical protein